jgi:3-hydroxybutyryl-CoA dehydratase
VKQSFAEFEIGDMTETTIAVTEEHFTAPGVLFEDRHPIHHDDAYAIEKGHPGKTLPGSMVGGIMSSSLAEMLSGAGLAMLEYAVRYRAPAYLGDVLTARCTVQRIEPKPHRGGGLLFLATTLHNQEGTLVAEGSAVDLVGHGEGGA